MSLLELGDDVDEVPQAAAETIESPHDECVAAAHVVQACLELRALADRARADVFEGAGAAGLLERVDLQCEDPSWSGL